MQIAGWICFVALLTAAHAQSGSKVDYGRGAYASRYPSAQGKPIVIHASVDDVGPHVVDRGGDVHDLPVDTHAPGAGFDDHGDGKLQAGRFDDRGGGGVIRGIDSSSAFVGRDFGKGPPAVGGFDPRNPEDFDDGRFGRRVDGSVDDIRPPIGGFDDRRDGPLAGRFVGRVDQQGQGGGFEGRGGGVIVGIDNSSPFVGREFGQSPPAVGGFNPGNQGRFDDGRDRLPVGGGFDDGRDRLPVGTGFDDDRDRLPVGGRFDDDRDRLPVGGRFDDNRDRLPVGGRFDNDRDRLPVGGRFDDDRDRLPVGGRFDERVDDHGVIDPHTDDHGVIDPHKDDHGVIDPHDGAHGKGRGRGRGRGSGRGRYVVVVARSRGGKGYNSRRVYPVYSTGRYRNVSGYSRSPSYYNYRRNYGSRSPSYYNYRRNYGSRSPKHGKRPYHSYRHGSSGRSRYGNGYRSRNYYNRYSTPSSNYRYRPHSRSGRSSY
ncbi:PREDICTED: uncharacterized protein LOC106805623 [Priapulus caudatus]|uniref:Uncharacterized protein LOC106805623 n=1 Tax=Priapulus caudatus TaxID=37621 RepID=A0ABM1DS75_PRICU|nr:PREDICTED: uncharacterized protein LOC106805623 [Priapulus caudatus]